MFAVYISVGRNSTVALSEYQLRFPNRRAPSRTIFARLEESLRNFGRFDSVPKSFPNEELETAILACMAVDSRRSAREVAWLCHTTHPTVLLVMRKHGIKPFKIPKVQHIRDSDRQRRSNFCRWFIENQERDSQFYSKIIWTDESNFSSRGFFNRKNTHYWAQEKQSVFVEANAQVRFSINVWCGLLGSQIIGPHFYQGTLSGPDYFRFIETELSQFLDDMPLNRRRHVIFMQDGAPAHNARTNITTLKAMFPGRLLATKGDILWPARSPDLTPLDFFLWGKVKDLVYGAENLPYATLDQLRRKIVKVFDELNHSEVRAATESVVRRCNLCLANDGAQFEHNL